MPDYHRPDRDKEYPKRQLRWHVADDLRLQAVLKARGVTRKQFLLEAVRAAEAGTLEQGAVTLAAEEVRYLQDLEFNARWDAERTRFPWDKRKLNAAAAWARARIDEVTLRERRRIEGVKRRAAAAAKAKREWRPGSGLKGPTTHPMPHPEADEQPAAARLGRSSQRV